MPSGVFGGKNSKLKVRGCFFCDSMSRLVGEIGREPALGLIQGGPLAPGVVRCLVLPDLVHGEITRVGGGGIKPAHPPRGETRMTFPEPDVALASGGPPRPR